MGKLGLLLMLATTAGLVTSCGPGAIPCPAIAQFSGVSVTVAADYAPQVEVLHLKACQDGQCAEAGLELTAGSVSVDQGCDAYGICSATSSPDGTKVGMLPMDTLTESALTVTASGFAPDGAALPQRVLEFRPAATYPFGEQCGKFLRASVTLDASGLRERDGS